MTRQWLINQIRKLKEETKLPNKIITSEGFLYQPKYELLREEYEKYRLDNEEWHQLVRFALSPEEEHRYMYERLLFLLQRHTSSHDSYFSLQTQNATVLLPDRIAEVTKLFSMYKEYFQIFKEIVNSIHFDYPFEKYKDKLIYGKINWDDTLRKNPIGFPLNFEISKWNRDFDIPENILLLLSAIWLNSDAKRLLRVNFIEPLNETEKSMLNYIISKTQNIATFFPFPDLLITTTKFSSLIPTDKRILQLEHRAQSRINQPSPYFNSYKNLLNWIRKYKRLNIKMISRFTSNFPLETIENLDTIYEAWLFFEIIDYFSNEGTVLKLEINREPKYFEFTIDNRTFTFFYEKRYLKGSEHAWAVESHPDFSILENNRIVAVFDAKNYGALSRSGDATHKMLAYMTNLDCGFGGLFFPNLHTEEYRFPREFDNPIHHFNLLLGHYNMKPEGTPDAIKVKNETMTMIRAHLTQPLLLASN